jgi:hypothetical protein
MGRVYSKRAGQGARSCSEDWNQNAEAVTKDSSEADAGRSLGLIV